MSTEFSLIFYTIVFFYALLFGTVTALAAVSRYRHPFVWFFVGFVFGVFGLIAILVLGKDEEDDAYHVESSNMKKCPDCAERVKIDAKICRFCGHKFNDKPPQSIQNTSVNDPEVLQKLIDKLNPKHD